MPLCMNSSESFAELSFCFSFCLFISLIIFIVLLFSYHLDLYSLDSMKLSSFFILFLYSILLFGNCFVFCLDVDGEIQDEAVEYSEGVDPGGQIDEHDEFSPEMDFENFTCDISLFYFSPLRHIIIIFYIKFSIL